MGTMATVECGRVIGIRMCKGGIAAEAGQGCLEAPF